MPYGRWKVLLRQDWQKSEESQTQPETRNQSTVSIQQSTVFIIDNLKRKELRAKSKVKDAKLNLKLET